MDVGPGNFLEILLEVNLDVVSSIKLTLVRLNKVILNE